MSERQELLSLAFSLVGRVGVMVGDLIADSFEDAGKARQELQALEFQIIAAERAREERRRQRRADIDAELEKAGQ